MGLSGRRDYLSSVELENSMDLDKKEPNTHLGWSFRTLIILSGTFLCALVIRLWFAFFDGHETIVYSCDASEYLRAAAIMQNILTEAANRWQDLVLYCLGMLPADKLPALHDAFHPFKELANRAGPTFPLFILFSHLATGNEISPEYFYAPVVFHCIITSISCALIAFIAIRGWGRAAGLSAGLLAAFYPGFIVNSIRLYSESYAAFWLLAALALLTHMHSTKRWTVITSLVMGYCLGILQITRSALVLATGAIFAFTGIFAGRKSWLRSLPAILVGLALAMLPVMVAQKLSTGASSLVQDRLSHYNLFVGLDVSAQGWLSYPYPDGRGIEDSSLLQLMHRRYEESHSRFIKLLADKPARLFKFPWNDFRTPIFNFAENTQVLYHQLCLMLAALGIGATIIDCKGKAKDENEAEKGEACRLSALRILILLILAIHGAYFFFITVPRYALTAMPMVLIFSGAGIYALSRAASRSSTFCRRTVFFVLASLALAGAVHYDYVTLFTGLVGTNSSDLTKVLILETLIKTVFAALFFAAIFLFTGKSLFNRTLTIVMSLAVIPFIALPLRAHGRSFEWKVDLKGTTGNTTAEEPSSFSQSIYIPGEKIEVFKNRNAYLLVDSESWKELGQFADISINGIDYKGPILPLMPFSQDLNLPQKSGDAGRLFYECEDIYRAVLDAAGGTNLDPRQWFILPLSPDMVTKAIAQDSPHFTVSIKAKSGKQTRVYGAYRNDDTGVWIPSVTRYSWEKFLYGVENEHGFTDSRFDEKYPIAEKATKCQNHSGAANIRILLAASEKKASTEKLSEKSNRELRSFSGTTDGIRLKELPSYDKDSIWAVTYKGIIESEIEKPVLLPLQVTATFSSADNKTTYTSPWVPSSLLVSKGLNQFSFTIPIKPSALSLDDIKITIARGGVADSTQFFGTFYKPQSRLSGLSRAEFETLLKSRIRWQESNLEIHQLPCHPTAIGYEIF